MRLSVVIPLKDEGGSVLHRAGELAFALDPVCVESEVQLDRRREP